MNPSRGVVAVVAGVMVLGVAVGAWWFLRPPAPGPEPGPAPAPAPAPPRMKAIRGTAASVGGAAYLVRLDAEAPPKPADAFWDGLFPALAADPETAACLKRLFGGLRVELVALDQPPGNDDPVWEKKPGPGFDVVLRVCNKGEHQTGTIEGQAGAGQSVKVAYLVGSLGWGYVVDADRPPDVAKAADGEIVLPPDAREAVELAVADYLLRNAAGWRGLHVGSFGEQAEFDRVAASHDKSADQRRKDLDARIDDYARRYRAFLAAQR